MPGNCQICGEALLRLVDFGPQPVCNRYASSAGPQEYRHPLVFSQCPRDGLLQLEKPFPSDEVRPRLPWISYQEPEPHLDDVVDRIVRLPGVGKETLIAGLSYKDHSVLDRLERRGYRNTWRVSLEELGVGFPGAGMESIQSVLQPAMGTALRKSRGAPGVVVVRHLLEHSNSMGVVLQALKSWGSPESHFVFEVPDSEETIRQLDVSTLWEEHISYFTEFTLDLAFAPHGVELVEITRYPYTLEDCLVAFVANRPAPRRPIADHAGLHAQLSLGENFRNGLAELERRCCSELEGICKAGGTAALLGAGHRATTFLNLLRLGGMFSCVIDDDPRKSGLFLPGTGLPILPSSHLAGAQPSLCLLAVAPDSEPAVLGRNLSYTSSGGRMASIYPRSVLAWDPLKPSAQPPR